MLSLFIWLGLVEGMRMQGPYTRWLSLPRLWFEEHAIDNPFSPAWTPAKQVERAQIQPAAWSWSPTISTAWREHSAAESRLITINLQTTYMSTDTFCCEPLDLSVLTYAALCENGWQLHSERHCPKYSIFPVPIFFWCWNNIVHVKTYVTTYI